MSKIIEKRTVNIPPCEVKKDLVKEIGELIEKEKLYERLSYSLDTKTKDIESTRIDDFVKSDWGTDINSMTIRGRYQSKTVNITIHFSYHHLSEFSVSGDDVIWVEGITTQITKLFEKYKQKYHQIRTNYFLKTSFISVISLYLAYRFLLPLSSLAEPDKLMEFYIVIGAFLTMISSFTLDSLINWLFPYYEYGETLQKQIRKIAWTLLAGSSY